MAPHAIFNIWEELWARFVEELRELDRQLRRSMREESPTFERIRFLPRRRMLMASTPENVLCRRRL